MIEKTSDTTRLIDGLEKRDLLKEFVQVRIEDFLLPKLQVVE